MSGDGELTIEECEYLDRIAEENGLCSNCFHTFACCGGSCWAMGPQFDPWTHICKPNVKEAAACRS